MNEQIYAYEGLAYFLGMKPSEFWNCEYREIIKYCNIQFIRILDDYKQDIILQEAVSDKLIKADAMSTKKPEILSLRKKIFSKLF